MEQLNISSSDDGVIVAEWVLSHLWFTNLILNLSFIHNKIPWYTYSVELKCMQFSLESHKNVNDSTYWKWIPLSLLIIACSTCICCCHRRRRYCRMQTDKQTAMSKTIITIINKHAVEASQPASTKETTVYYCTCDTYKCVYCCFSIGCTWHSKFSRITHIVNSQSITLTDRLCYSIFSAKNVHI